MSGTSNSLSEQVAELANLQANAIAILEAMQRAVLANTPTVTVGLPNLDGTTTSYVVPSLGFVESELKRLDTNLQELMGLDSTDANVRLADGSFRKIMQARLARSPERIRGLITPGKFNFKNNWFFESFLSPLLYVSVDISDFSKPETNKVMVKRLILNTDNDQKKAYFDQNIKGRNNINYQQLITDLQSQSISFFLDDDTQDLPLSVMRFEGSFDVISYEDVSVTGATGEILKKRKYRLNKLTYSDNLSSSAASVELKIKDRLATGETTYEIESIDRAENKIILKRLSGFESITVGPDVLRIQSDIFSSKRVQVPIGFDERQVVFFRVVEPNFNTVSALWSDGIAFYSNELTVDTTQGQMPLSEFYRKEVLDFGQQFMALAKEKTISAVVGETPTAPTLSQTDFQVVLVNEHKRNAGETEEIRKKASDKIRLFSELSELNASIEKKKEELATKKFNSDAERRGVRNELTALTKEKTSKSTLYVSLVKELSVIANDNPATLEKPKYRIRGFFQIPEPKTTNGLVQQIVQFIVMYRYLRIDGSSIGAKQFEFVNSQGQTLRGNYSNWNEVRSQSRKKIFNDGTGEYEWATEDIENPDSVNINQIDIPISTGEKVELKVISVSEAGWPTNPLLSEDSNTIIVDFPSNLISVDEATLAIADAQKEEIRVTFQEELNARGLDVHLSEQFTTGENFFAHTSDNITSGFFTNEGKVISLFEKLKSLETELANLKAQVQQVKGKLQVFILDEDGNKIPIKNGSLIPVFAGYYTDYITVLPISERKGAIITKSYKMILENGEATPLELISRLPGGIDQTLPSSNILDLDAITPADADYSSARRYELVPIVNNSISAEETNNASKISQSFHESQQLKSQFVYSRYTDIGLKAGDGDLYVNPPTIPARSFYPSIPTNGTDTFVWNGNYASGVPQGNGVSSLFSMHIDHPKLNNGLSTSFAEFLRPNIEIGADGYPTATQPEGISTFQHSYNFNLQSTEVNGKKQLTYRNNWKSSNVLNDIIIPAFGPTPTYPVTITNVEYNVNNANQYVLPDKCGFVDNDKYLIGKNTCGSYLYLAPSTFDQLLVDGTDNLAVHVLSKGEGLEIPITFQFRMTDYYGIGSAGVGIIGGYDPSLAVQSKERNLIYTKRIGIDIYRKNETMFSFDIEVSAKYSRESLSQKVDVIGNRATKVRTDLTLDKSKIKNSR